MIEKLDIKDYENKQQLVWFGIINKLNELCDIINAIIIDVDGTKCVDGSKAPADNSEKANCQENVPDLDIQLSWIGYLCRFWDNNKIESTYAILDDINVWCEHPYRKSNGNQYKHCEPVKPDDDIIYKGV